MTDATDQLAIRSRDLTKRFGSRTAVDSVSLEVKRGEVYGFVGLNGAGKTTFMRMLVGLARPTSGVAEVLGQQRLTNDVLRRVGTMIEGPTFYAGLTGAQNLELIARYSRIPRSGIDAALETVDLGSRAASKFKGYSLGMKQRLGLACALLGDPELLILDEPTNGLDPAGMSAMRDLIREQAEIGRTVMLSSHLLGEISQVCDRIGVLHQGRLITVGTPREIEQQYTAAHEVLVTCDRPQEAAAIARDVPGVEDVRVAEDGIEAEVPPEHSAALIQALVAGGVAVQGMRARERSLEEAFLQMTSTGKNTEAAGAAAEKEGVAR
ncbi:ATP-binding cassette domain-containing protein [Brachybacterium sp. DNPG3]